MRVQGATGNHAGNGGGQVFPDCSWHNKIRFSSQTVRMQPPSACSVVDLRRGHMKIPMQNYLGVIDPDMQYLNL